MNFFDRVNRMTPAEALVAYLERGKSVFPVGPDKRPRLPWKIYQTGLATPYEVQKWLERGVEALGFPTGAYNSYNVLDADTPEAEEWLREHAPATPLVSRTRRGLHRFYRCGTLQVPTVTGLGPGGIDARGAGGFVICPPSVILGHRYTWEIGSGPVPTLDCMGEQFFRPGLSPSQAVTGGPQGGGRSGGDRGAPDLSYTDDGLVARGCRDVFMRDVVWSLVAGHVRDNGTLPDPEYIAGRAWEIFYERADLSDGKGSYDECLEKAIYAVARVGSGERIIDDDSEIGDAAAYEESF